MVRRNIGNVDNAATSGVISPPTPTAPTVMEGSQAPTVNGTSPQGASSALGQSRSVPATPQSRPRYSPGQPRSPSLDRKPLYSSPSSALAHSVPAVPRRNGGCKYEVGMAKARRRVPYSFGSEKLDKESREPKSNLDPAEDEKLSGDMRELYDRLLPSEESEQRRRRLVNKLEILLSETWPGHKIKVNVFGSTGNDLGTTDSDVDICITTDWKEMERVCSLAALLAKNGMERVVCVSNAKIPIVKVWDPELQLACDLNVNNPIALENTELIRAYVGLDDRVRPLAMIIKHWAKRRILNDAALGFTLSSYTWICMIINFLQCRNPPILPSLQQKSELQPKLLDGVNVAFDHDMEAYRDFGAENTESLGTLLFNFFRDYGHEIDYETSVMSVRAGKLLTKKEKGWHLLQDNRLCVEEPFNTTRNLANTADDTSMRGIHLELRRAFREVSAGNLQSCCEQYVPPREEAKPSEIFVPPVSRPVVPQAPIQAAKGPKAATMKAQRGPHPFGRGGGGGRRTSNLVNRPSHLRNLPFQMTPHELQLQAQHQQHLLHDQLFQQYQFLQAQEQQLRLQLHEQAVRQGRTPTTASYPHIPFPSHSSYENSNDDNSSTTSTSHRQPMSAPIRQQRFPYASPYLDAAILNGYASSTNPPSPLLNTVLPDTRRTSRRATTAQIPSSGSLRAHSQPARSLAMPLMFHQQRLRTPSGSTMADDDEYRQGRRSPRSHFAHDTPLTYLPRHMHPLSYARHDEGQRPAEFIGYYVGHSPPFPAYSRSAGISPVPSQVGLAIQNGGLSPRFFTRAPSFPSTSMSPRPERASVASDELIISQDQVSNSSAARSFDEHMTTASNAHSGPLVVNGSTTADDDNAEDDGDVHDGEGHQTFSTSTSEDLAFDTPGSSDDQSQGQPETADLSIQINGHRPDPSVAVHGSTNGSKSNSVLSPSNVDFSTNVLFTSEQLSPVKELPSPNMNHNDVYPAKFEMNGIKDDAHSQVTHPQVAASSTELSGLKYSALEIKTNVIESDPQRTSSKPQTNGWQTQKSKKKSKKTAMEENAEVLADNQLGGDHPPMSENLRKGG